jgi:hypothetical protein
MKVKTDIIASIAASPIGRVVILLIMYVETFKTVVIVFISNVVMCLMSLWPINVSITVSLLITTLSLCEIKGIITVNFHYHISAVTRDDADFYLTISEHYKFICFLFCFFYIGWLLKLLPVMKILKPLMTIGYVFVLSWQHI